MLAHLLGGLFFFVGPLIIWLLKKEESPFVNDQGKEALNFQITVAIALVAATIVGSILAFIPFAGACLAPLVFAVVPIGNLVFAILGCMAANKGTPYRYPFALRLIS